MKLLDKFNWKKYFKIIRAVTILTNVAI
jgi:hypothetical protein